MVITKTAIAFILLALGLGVCGWRFFVAFKKSGQNNKSGFLVTLFISVCAIQNAVLGFGMLFFADNEPASIYILLLAQLLLSAHAVIAVYTIFYIFFPTKIRAPFLLIAYCLSIITLLRTVIERPSFSLNANKSLDWILSPLLSTLTFLLLAISISSFMLIFLRLSSDNVSRSLRRFSLFFAIGGFLALAAIFIKFLLFPLFFRASGQGFLDIGIGFAGFLFIIALFILPALETINKS